MNKSQTLAVVVIVAAVGVGAAVFIAAGTPEGTTTAGTSEDLSGTPEGLEAEQSGEAIPGEQPTDELSPGETIIREPLPEGSGANASTANQSGINTTGSGGVPSGSSATPADNPFSDFT